MRELPPDWYEVHSPCGDRDETILRRIEQELGKPLAEFLRMYSGSRFLKIVGIQLGKDSDLPFVNISEVESLASIRKAFEHGDAKPDTIEIATDSCGNSFLIERTLGSVIYEDHETEDRYQLAKSINEFLTQLQVIDIELDDPDAEVWIHPDFLD